MKLQEFLLLDANFGLLGVAVCYWSKPLARAINNWFDRAYEKFTRPKSPPESRNANTELNYKATFLCLRLCGAALVISAIYFALIVLQLIRE
jgi:hypothetical protein